MSCHGSDDRAFHGR